jgi:hypothetical protein
MNLILSLIAQLDKDYGNDILRQSDYWGNNIIEFNPHVVLIYQARNSGRLRLFKERMKTQSN